MIHSFFFSLFLLFFFVGHTKAVVGDIEFQLTGIPSTWEGFSNGMVQPRNSPTNEVNMEFSGLASNASYSIVHATTTTASDDHVPLSMFDGFVLDLWVQHANGLWPCVSADGDERDLRIPSYDSVGRIYKVQADYVINSYGEFFFNTSLLVQTP